MLTTSGPNVSFAASPSKLVRTCFTPLLFCSLPAKKCLKNSFLIVVHFVFKSPGDDSDRLGLGKYRLGWTRRRGRGIHENTTSGTHFAVAAAATAPGSLSEGDRNTADERRQRHWHVVRAAPTPTVRDWRHAMIRVRVIRLAGHLASWEVLS